MKKKDSISKKVGYQKERLHIKKSRVSKRKTPCQKKVGYQKNHDWKKK